MGKASRDKGKRGEREVVDLFKAHGLSAHRSAQVDGTLSSDVVVDVLPQLHVEVKRYSKIGAMRFMDQAERDAKASGPYMAHLNDTEGRHFPRSPVLFMREDGGPWRVMIDVDHFFDLVEGTYH